MSKEKKIVRFDKDPLSEPMIPADTTNDGKVHVDLYLKAKEVPLWERGGRRAFATAKGKERATEQEFEELFQTY